jgi:Tfp pilus assembly protein PilZ
MTMNSTARDRRSERRFPLRVVAGARPWRSALPEQNVELINFSAQGLYFASGQRYREGDLVEMSLKLPLVTEGPLPEWRCVGNVVRVQPLAAESQIVGVALQLDEGRVSQTAQGTAGGGLPKDLRAYLR